jgi:SAM-dependent methyltransferase
MTLNRPLASALAMLISCSAYAADSKAPSRFRRFCETALISSGLYQPQPKAYFDPHVRSELKTPNYVVKLSFQSVPGDFSYLFNNRDMHELYRQQLLPARFFTGTLLYGKTVLDLDCGEGLVVEDLRRMGVDALGMSPVLTPYQSTKEYFARAAADRIPMDDDSVDVILSISGPLRYYPHDRQLVRNILLEAKRVLRKGGVLRISPVDLQDLVDLTGIAPDEDFAIADLRLYLATYGANPIEDLKHTAFLPLPEGMAITGAPDADWFRQQKTDAETFGPYYWLEITKTGN